MYKEGLVMNEFEVKEIIREEREKKFSLVAAVSIFILFGVVIWAFGRFTKDCKQTKDDVQLLKEKVERLEKCLNSKE
jgi:p-aminobenzoyl-glutamate transporter AbgT